MNVYDFDKTIYDGDSSIDFFVFEYKNHPKLFKLFPKVLYSFIKYKTRLIKKSEFKSCFFEFVKFIDLDNEVLLFWDANQHKIKDWYIKQKKNDDLIISASPNFLINEICLRLNVRCLASNVDYENGKYICNFYGEEKVKQFKKRYKTKINNFYTDSKSDLPLAKISNKAYIVNGNKIERWTI